MKRDEFTAEWTNLDTAFIVQAYQTSTELLNAWCRAATFFSASGAALSQEVADGKINIKSASALNTRYNHGLLIQAIGWTTE
jgi:hypothetical protein